MQRYTNEKRVLIVKTYYQNGESIVGTFRNLRDHFGIHNRPSKTAITKLIEKFERTGSVTDVKTALRPRSGRSAENIAAVEENVADDARTSIRRRAQQLDLSRSTVQRILTKDLHLHAYKIQLTQTLKPADHGQRREFCNWVLSMQQDNPDFAAQIIFSDEAHFQLNGYVNKQNCRIWGAENPRVIEEQPMHPPRVTVWCGFWAGGVIGPFFLKTLQVPR